MLSTCSESHGKLTVFSMKAMLATMCGGKIVDKLRCKYNFDCFFLKADVLVNYICQGLHVVTRVKHTGALLQHIYSIHLF